MTRIFKGIRRVLFLICLAAWILWSALSLCFMSTAANGQTVLISAGVFSQMRLVTEAAYFACGAFGLMHLATLRILVAILPLLRRALPGGAFLLASFGLLVGNCAAMIGLTGVVVPGFTVPGFGFAMNTAMMVYAPVAAIALLAALKNILVKALLGR